MTDTLKVNPVTSKLDLTAVVDSELITQSEADSRYVNITGDTMTGALSIDALTGNTLVVDTTTLVVDATNNRVGIGTSSPSHTLDVSGEARFSGFGFNHFLIRNSSTGTVPFRVDTNAVAIYIGVNALAGQTVNLYGSTTAQSNSTSQVPLIAQMAASQTTTAGFEVRNSNGTALFRLTPDTITDEGGLAMYLFARNGQDRGLIFDPGGANTRPKISTLASAGFNLNDGAMFGPSFSDESLPNFIVGGLRFGRDTGNYAIVWSPRANDTATYSFSITGQAAYVSGSTNQNGGPINITGGSGSSDSGKTGLGGNVVINGGVKSPSGTDGNVILAGTRGYVGVGTASPDSLLTVSAAGTSVVSVQATGALGSARSLLQLINPASGGTGWDFGYNIDQSTQNFSIRELTGGSTTYRLVVQKTTGNVGIGIGTPQGILQVKQASNINLMVNTTTSGFITINAINDANSANIPLELRSSKTIFSSGSVGIGNITTPDATFHVSIAGTASTDGEIARFNSTDATSHPYITVGTTSAGGFLLYNKESARTRLGMHGGTSYAFEFDTTGSIIHAAGVTTAPLGAAGVLIGTAATKGFVIKTAGSQTANPFEVQNSSGTEQALIRPNGGFYSNGPATDTLYSGNALTGNYSFAGGQGYWAFRTGSAFDFNIDHYNTANTPINSLKITRDGVITFGFDVNVPDEAYGSGWNGSLEVPTKNAIYDKIETIANDVLFDHFTDTGNVGTGEDDLYTDTLAAGQLSINGQKIIAQYGGTEVGDATSTQRIRAYFGGTLIFDTGALGIGVSTVNWDLYITIIRVSASVVRCSAALNTSFASLNAYAQYTEVTGLTLANTQVLKITGEAAGVTAATNQIIAKEGYVEFKPAA